MTAIRPHRAVFVSTVPVLALLVWAALSGVMTPELYAPFASPEYVLESQAQDFVTLLFGAPLIAIGALAAWTGRAWGTLLWAGCLAFELYVYAIYLLGAVLSHLFFAYLAIEALALFGFIALLVFTAKHMCSAAAERLPLVVAALLAVIALMFATIWLSELAGDIQRQRAGAAHLIYVIDLVVVLPAYLICAWLLVRQYSAALAVSVVLLIKLLSLCLSILLGQALRAQAGLETEGFLLVLFGGIGAITLPVLALSLHRAGGHALPQKGI